MSTSKFPIEVSFDTRSSTDVLRGSCAPGNSPESVFAFTAPKAGTYELSTAGSSFNTVLYVLDGSCQGRELACNDDDEGALTSFLTLKLAKGQTVSVVVDGLDAQAGKGTLRVVDANGLACCETSATGGCGVRTVEECVCAVDSFCCESAWDSGCVDTMLAHGCGSCAESGQCETQSLVEGASPLPVALDSGVDAVRLSCGELGIADALFAFTAGEAGLYRFSTRDTDADTVVGVLDSQACNAAELACNDDGIGGKAAEVTTFLQANQAVLVVVEAFDSSAKASSLTAKHIGAAPDDACGAVPLPTAALAVVSGRLEGTTSGPLGSCAVDLGGNDLYWFKAPAAGSYQFDTSGSFVDTTLAAFTGCAGSELACNDDNTDGSGSRLTLDLAADQEVVISVASFENGAYSLAYGLAGTPGIVFPGTSCCAEHDAPGCKTPELSQCVCGTYAYCCEQGWDSLCVEAVTELGCGICE